MLHIHPIVLRPRCAEHSHSLSLSSSVVTCSSISSHCVCGMVRNGELLLRLLPCRTLTTHNEPHTAEFQWYCFNTSSDSQHRRRRMHKLTNWRHLFSGVSLSRSLHVWLEQIQIRIRNAKRVTIFRVARLHAELIHSVVCVLFRFVSTRMLFFFSFLYMQHPFALIPPHTTATDPIDVSDPTAVSMLSSIFLGNDIHLNFQFGNAMLCIREPAMCILYLYTCVSYCMLCTNIARTQQTNCVCCPSNTFLDDDSPLCLHTNPINPPMASAGRRLSG